MTKESSTSQVGQSKRKQMQAEQNITLCIPHSKTHSPE
jgi:hypothetical protein